MIKQPWLLVVSGICLLVALVLGLRQALFVMRAVETNGVVASVDSRDARCGSSKRRYPCTKFQAQIEYTVPAGTTHRISVSAGSSRGYGRPVSSADLGVGETVPVVYAPGNPSKAYRNTIFGVWGAPLVAGFAQIATLLGSMSEGRRRRW